MGFGQETPGLGYPACFTWPNAQQTVPSLKGALPTPRASVPLDTLYPYAAKAAADAAAAPALAPAIAAALPAVDFLLRPFAVPLAVLPEPLGRPRLRAEWPRPAVGISWMEIPVETHGPRGKMSISSYANRIFPDREGWL